MLNFVSFLKIFLKLKSYSVDFLRQTQDILDVFCALLHRSSALI